MREFILFVLATSGRAMVAVVVVAVISGVAGAGVIALVSQIFISGTSYSRSELILYAVLLAALVLLVLLLELLAKWLLARHSGQRARDIRTNLVYEVFRKPLRETEKIGISRHMTIYSEDTTQLTNAMNSVAPVGISLFVLLGCFVYLIWLSPKILAMLVAISVPALWIANRIHTMSSSQSKLGFKYRDGHVHHVELILKGIKELTLNCDKQNRFLKEEYLPLIEKHKSADIKAMVLYALGAAWTQFYYFALFVAALAYVILSGSDPKIFGPFVLIALYMKSHLGKILGAIPNWTRAGVILNRQKEQGFFDIRGESIQPSPPKTRSIDTERSINIEASDLAYTYKSKSAKEDFTVGPISLSFQNPELVFLVGQNGAGKSTLAKLLCGLYRHQSGTLSCNGTVITDDNIVEYRQLFSVLFTEPFVLHQLVAERQSNFDDRITDSDIAEYLVKFGLQDKVVVSGHRLNTTLLSHGQRKRLALLSACLEDKPVLIFDEWAENQDPEFKELFYHEILPELRDRGKIVIVISHESQFFKLADRLIKL